MVTDILLEDGRVHVTDGGLAVEGDGWFKGGATFHGTCRFGSDTLLYYHDGKDDFIPMGTLSDLVRGAIVPIETLKSLGAGTLQVNISPGLPDPVMVDVGSAITTLQQQVHELRTQLDEARAKLGLVATPA